MVEQIKGDIVRKKDRQQLGVKQMSFFNRIATTFLKTMERRAASSLYQQLRLMDSRTLLNAGISPELLAKGPGAYPWREQDAKATDAGCAAVTLMQPSNEAFIRQGIAELQACSDVELADMGIARSDIARVVREGRPGIDRPEFGQGRQAAA